jgi:hypothetical protein
LTIEQRLVTAFVSTVVAGLTIAIVAVGAYLRGPMNPESGEHFWRLSGFACVAAGVLGFAVGPERMARHFGFLWGTEQPTTIQMVVTLIVVLAICSFALFRWPAWL